MERKMVLLADFIQDDRFELTYYLAYIFNQTTEFPPSNKFDLFVK
ncbi:hypothetical protein [Peribacillus sp. NPDC097295]